MGLYVLDADGTDADTGRATPTATRPASRRLGGATGLSDPLVFAAGTTTSSVVQLRPVRIPRTTRIRLDWIM